MVTGTMGKLRELWDNRGQGLVEYGLILVLIAIIVLLMLKGLGGTINDTYSSINSAMP